MNEQDYRAVETMVLSGLDLDALCRVFPAFDKDALRMVYESVKETVAKLTGVTEPKCNCS